MLTLCGLDAFEVVFLLLGLDLGLALAQRPRLGAVPLAWRVKGVKVEMSLSWRERGVFVHKSGISSVERDITLPNGTFARRGDFPVSY